MDSDSSSSTAGLEVHAFVELLMGHQQIAGRVTEEQVAGKAMLRVDVPDRTEDPGTGFTRFYSAGALYALTPSTAERVQAWVDYRQPDRDPVYIPPSSPEAGYAMRWLAEREGASEEGADW